MSKSISILGTSHRLQGALKAERIQHIDDPSYKKYLEDQLRPKLVDFVFEEASECGPTIAEKVATELLGKGRYLDVDPHPDTRANFGIPPLQNHHTPINLVGVSLLLCLLNFLLGRIVTCLSLAVVFALPEIERDVGHWQKSDLVRLVSLLEVAALSREVAALDEKYHHLQQLIKQIFLLAQTVPSRATQTKKKDAFRCKLLAAHYSTWVHVRLDRPYEEELRAWKDLLKEAQTSRVSFKGFWSFKEAKKFLSSNGRLNEGQRNQLHEMVEAMKRLGGSP